MRPFLIWSVQKEQNKMAQFKEMLRNNNFEYPFEYLWGKPTFLNSQIKKKFWMKRKPKTPMLHFVGPLLHAFTTETVISCTQSQDVLRLQSPGDVGCLPVTAGSITVRHRMPFSGGSTRKPHRVSSVIRVPSCMLSISRIYILVPFP